MEQVVVPVTDVNSDVAVLTQRFVDDGATVRRDDVLGEAETSKAVIELTAPSDGVVCWSFALGAEVRLGEAVALILPDLDALEVHRRRQAEAAPADDPASDVRATNGARELAARHGIDLASLAHGGLVTTKEVEAALAAVRRATVDPERLPRPLAPTRAGVRRLVLIGAGLGATQVLDIIGHDPDSEAVALVDEDTARWGDEVDGVPVVGGTDRLEELFAASCFDAAVITISTSVTARARLRECVTALGIPLANAIDPTARIASGVRLGSGNVICAFCHFGVGTVVGDNTFLSAYNSYDHHTVIGSDVSTGPGCLTSGLVHIGDRVRMGTGIFIEPKVEVGDDAVVASGAVLVRSVPAGHVVKARAGATTVSPRRPGP